MRDITICQNCPCFMENELYPFRSWLGIWPGRYDFNTCRQNEVSNRDDNSAWEYNRRSSCDYDGFDWKELCLKAGYKDLEYYRLPIPNQCKYKMEQTMYEYNGYGGKSSEPKGFKFFLKGERVCQHCGNIIPNSIYCPVCGYKWFLREYREESAFDGFFQFVAFVLLSDLRLWCKLKSIITTAGRLASLHGKHKTQE